MEFKDIVYKRYAAKQFDGTIIPQSKVDELLEIIRHSASSYNIQPWKILIVKDSITKEKLAPAAWNQTQITTCSHLLIFCANSNINANIDKLEKAMPQATEYITIIREFAKTMNQEQSLVWAQKQTYLALGNAINGAKSLGFDSCPMEGFNSHEFSKILKLPANIIPTVLCPIGYATDSAKPKYRFAAAEIVI